MSYDVTYVLDDVGLRTPAERRAKLGILGQTARRLLLLDRSAEAGRQEPALRVRYERAPPEHRFVFSMDGFGWRDRRRASSRMQVLLDGLTALQLAWLDRHPRTPPLYRSGVRYEREPEGREDWQDIPTTLRRRSGDCEDLATWRASELLARGQPARAVGRARPMIVRADTGGPELGTLWHIVTRTQGGRIDDPSRRLGMEGGD